MPLYAPACAKRAAFALICSAAMFFVLPAADAGASAHARASVPAFVQWGAPSLSARWLAFITAHQTSLEAARFTNADPGEDALPLARQALREAHPARARYLALLAVERADDDQDTQRQALHIAGYASWLAEDFAGAVSHLERAEALATQISPALDDATRAPTRSNTNAERASAAAEPPAPPRDDPPATLPRDVVPSTQAPADDAALALAPDADLLAPWRRAWLADAAFRLGDDDAAIRWAALSEDSSTRYLPLHLARGASARAQARLPDAPNPRPLEAFIATYPEYPQLRDARAELALAWIRTGALDRAADELDYAFQNYPWAPQTARLREALREHPELQAHLPQHTADDRLARAREWRALRQWPTAEAALLTLRAEAIARNATPAERGPIDLELALNATEEGRYELAHTRFKALDEAGWPGVSTWEGLRDYGWNLARLDRHNDAMTLLRRSAAERGGQAGQDSLFEYLYDLGHFSEARAVLDTVSRRERPDAFTTIMLTYLSSDYAHALADFDALARRSSSHAQHQANYWAARAELHLGHVQSARARFEAIVRARPHDYYGILASSRLADLDAGSYTDDDTPGAIKLQRKRGVMHWDGPLSEHAADFRVVAEDTASIHAYAPELPAPAPLDALIEDWAVLFPDLHRAYALAQIGADEEARQVFRRVVLEVTRLRSSGRTPAPGRPIDLPGDLWAHWTDNRPQNKRGWWGHPLNTPAYDTASTGADRDAAAARQREILSNGTALTDALIAIGRHLEDHHVVRRLVQRERGLSGIPPTDGERTDWLEAYPRPFPSTVLSHTRRAQLNPYLLWGLIIVESDMNPDAISRADAYGLTQVIPKTADRLAWELGDTSFGIHELLDPHISIRYGAWYFGGLVHKFSNQESLALIGYNAGPHRVARWLDWRGAELDYDEFLEMVPFPGARNYHKRILRYTATYQMLYEGALRIYIGLDLDLDYDPAINF